MVRAVIFWSATLLLALWALAGAVALGDALLADCASAASELGDPCVPGKGSYLLYGSLAWLAGAAPLVAILIALRRGR